MTFYDLGTQQAKFGPGKIEPPQDDKQAWSDQLRSLSVHDEESMRLQLALTVQAAGSACYHRAAIECSNTSFECTGAQQVEGDHRMFPCICEACPNYFNAIIKVIPIFEHLQPNASNSGVIQDLISELCPAMATVKCMITAPSCLAAGFMDSPTGRAFEYLAAMRPQCISSNLPMDYTEADQFVYASPSSCPYISSTQSPTSPESPSQSRAVALQQTFLAGIFWLLSILNGMWVLPADSRIELLPLSCHLLTCAEAVKKNGGVSILAG